jgi:TFIIF-interacting CTD phosphatase-like protein
MANNRPLLILDLDETLIHSLGRPLATAPDFMLGPYHVYRRPNLADFLARCAERYTLAVWSSAGSEYVDGIVKNIFPDAPQPAFVWSKSRCTTRMDAELRDEVYLKDLSKVKRLGFNLSRILIVEDEPRKVARHYGNAIIVEPFMGASDDAELAFLGRYLDKIHEAPNFRQVEKRGWKRTVLGNADRLMEE